MLPAEGSSVNPDLDITHIGSNEFQKAVFVRFRYGNVMFLDFEKWLPEDVAAQAVAVYTGYDESTQELVIPLFDSSEHRIHVLVLLAASIEPTRTRFEAEALGYATKWGHAIRKARERRGWSQTELAMRAGTHQCMISRLEIGVHMPQVATIDRMCRTFGISRYELLSGREPEARQESEYDWFDELCNSVPELRGAGGDKS